MKKKLIIFLICFLFSGVLNAATGQDRLPRFRHDYAHMLVMKIFLSKPDGKGGSQVNMNFEQALTLMKQVNGLTLGIPKIIYLVGAIYNGHDDQYPAFFEINKKLKRRQDASAIEGLVWLIQEARVQLNNKLPEDIQNYFLIAISRPPPLEFVNSTVNSHLARAVLVKTRSVLIENNLFRETTGTAVHLGAEGDWREGPGSADIIICNNRFVRCGL